MINIWDSFIRINSNPVLYGICSVSAVSAVSEEAFRE